MGRSVVALACVVVLALFGGRPGDALGVPRAEMAGGIRTDSDRDKPVDFPANPILGATESAEPVHLPTDVTGGYLLVDGDEEDEEANEPQQVSGAWLAADGDAEDDAADEPVPVSGSWLLASDSEQESSTTDDPSDLIVIPPDTHSYLK